MLSLQQITASIDRFHKKFIPDEYKWVMFSSF